MSSCLVDRFFEEEFDEHVRHVVEGVVAAKSGSRYLTFNVFNVSIDMDAGSVTVEDELDPSAECSISLVSFLARMRRGESNVI